MLFRSLIFREMSQTLSAVMGAQQVASTPMPVSQTFFTCLFPHWTPTDHFLIFIVGVPLLLLVELFVVRFAKRKWAIASVSAAVLQLSYLGVMNTGSALLRGRELLFYDSTSYLVNGTSSTAPLFSRTVLEADVRVDYLAMRGYYAAAWAVCVGFGVGVPVWFVLAYL